MAEETYHISEGDTFSAVIATGSVVAGDFVTAYQTGTDDMFAAAGKSNYVPGSVYVERQAAAKDEVVGIAQYNAGSNEKVAIDTQGLYIVKAQSSTAGLNQTIDNSVAQSVQDMGSDTGSCMIGKAITGASGANKFILFRLNC